MLYKSKNQSNKNNKVVRASKKNGRVVLELNSVKIKVNSHLEKKNKVEI